MFISQTRYIDDVEDCKPVSTPIEPGKTMNPLIPLYANRLVDA